MKQILLQMHPRESVEKEDEGVDPGAEIAKSKNGCKQDGGDESRERSLRPKPSPPAAEAQESAARIQQAE